MSRETCIFPKVKECTDDKCPIAKGIEKGVPLLLKGVLKIEDMEIDTSCGPDQIDISITLYMKKAKNRKVVSQNQMCVIPGRECAGPGSDCPAWLVMEDFEGCALHLAEKGIDELKAEVRAKIAEAGQLWGQIKGQAGKDRYTGKVPKKESQS